MPRTPRSVSYRYHLGLSALVYVALAVLVGVAAANRPNNLLVLIFGLMIAAVLVGGVASGAMLMAARVVRLDPRHGRVGEPMVIRYAVSNRSRLLPLFNLELGEAAGGAPDDWSTFAAPATAWVLQVGRGETVHGEAVLWPARRGRMRLGAVRISSAFPFGLLRKSVTFAQPQETLVYPRLVPLRPEFLRSLAAGGFGGVRMSSASGAGQDYFGMREYKPGDSLRQIAWRRTAVLDTPITIERTRPSPPRLRVVLNLRRPTESLRYEPQEAVSARELEERAISLAASILQLAERQGFEVGLTVAGLRERPTPLRRGHWHVQKLLAALAGLDLDAPRAEELPPATPDAERAAIVVVSPDRADPALGREDGEGILHLTARQLERLALAEPDASPGEAAA